MSKTPLFPFLPLVLAAALLTGCRSRPPHPGAPAIPPGAHSILAPPGHVPTPKAIPSRKTALQKTVHCLEAISDAGASQDSLAETRGLIARLDTTPQSFARPFSAVLTSVLSYGSSRANQTTDSSASIPAYSGISKDLANRAASACYEKGRAKSDEIVLSFAGDCTFGAVNGDSGDGRFPSVYRRAGQPAYPFKLVAPWFRNDDLTVVNFECTLTNAVKTANKQWHFKGPAGYASIFPAGSVEAVGLSNNHSFDYLQAGFNDTVTNFKNAHVPVFYQTVPYITTLKGVRTVIIGDCTVVGENTTKIDGAPERVINQIRRYKEPDNIVIVMMHWGSELDTTPRPWQQDMGRQFIDAGADAVVGAHPHVLQGIERYKGKIIAYSLGNFAFGGNSLAHAPDTCILRLRFHTTGGRLGPADTSIVPCWVTSSQMTNEAGVLRNNYQPRPVFGEPAARTISLLLKRSSGLKYGMKTLEFLRLQ
ncbi:MAG: CapA family protein [Armatimonadota bacterium]|nr:CapA family protein [Armatimonadota bacterium]